MNKDTMPITISSDVISLQKRVIRLKRLAAKYKRAEIIQNALLGVSNIATQATSLDSFYQGVHQHLKQLIPADNFFIASQDVTTGLISLPFFADEKDPHPTELYPDQEISAILASGMTGYVLRTCKYLLCDYAKFDELIDSGDIESRGSPCHQWLGVPIINGDTVSGVLVVQSYDEQISYGDLEVELMTFICHHISGVMERLMRQEQLEVAITERTKELSLAYNTLKLEVNERVRAEKLQKLLFEIADLSASGVPEQQFYQQLHLILTKVIPADNGFIALKDDNNMLSFPFYVSQRSTSYPAPRMAKDGLTEYILRHKQPALFSATDIARLVANGEIYAQSPELNRTQEMHQWIGVPLVIHGEVSGALTIFSIDVKQNYIAKDLELLTFASQHIANAIERQQSVESLKRSHDQLEDKVIERTKALAEVNSNLQKEMIQRQKFEAQLVHDAQHDALTGLPNRSYLMDRLAHALKHVRRHNHEQFAVLFIDLDRFKIINDTLGHLEGDRFLIETAKRLKSCIRENDTLARMGGDEFVIILDAIHHNDDAKEVSQRIINSISAPYTLANQSFISGASVGVSFSGQKKIESSESLLRDADSAMYQAKAQGKGCFVIFDNNVAAQAAPQKDLKQDLEQAIDDQVIAIDYIELVNFHTNEVIAIEPTMRWEHPVNGLLNHKQIHKLANQHQLALNLDAYVFAQIEENIEHLKSQYGSEVELHLSISSQHIKNKYAVRGLKSTIKNSHIDLSKLVLFFNEKALVKDAENHINGFEVINQLGAKIGISEYGTGYSSLSSLSFLPIFALKLDADISKHLLNEKQLLLVKAYLLTAKTLGFDIFATGVDNPTQLKKLIELGYQQGQGKVFQ